MPVVWQGCIALRRRDLRDSRSPRRIAKYIPQRPRSFHARVRLEALAGDLLCIREQPQPRNLYVTTIAL